MRTSSALWIALFLSALARGALAGAPVAPPPASGGTARAYDPATFETLRWGAAAPYPPFVASSSLPPERTSYGPENVVDDSPFTAWVEGRPDDGIGEWIELRSPCGPPEGTTARLVVFDGYQKSPALFEDNGRVKGLAVALAGADHGSLALADVMGPQEFPIPVSWGQTVRLTITEVYPGRKWRDTALSELFIDCRDEPLPDPGPADARCCVVEEPETVTARSDITLAACKALSDEDNGRETRWSAGRVCETICCRFTTETDVLRVRHERVPRGSCTEEPLQAAEVVAISNCH
jgi:hypothetical protein